MKKNKQLGIWGILLSFSFLAASCTKTGAALDSSSPTVIGLSTALDTLSTDLTLVENCNTTYVKVLADLQKVKTAFEAVKTEQNVQLPQAADFEKRFNNLEDEATYIMNACADQNFVATDQITSGRITAALAEWKIRIDYIRANLLTEDATNNNISLATPTGVTISAATPAGSVFQDGTESYLPTMVVVPPGSYTMGGNLAEQERMNVPATSRHYELPAHPVTISKSFAVGATEVTLGQFKQFAQETNYKPLDGCRCWIPNQASDLPVTAGRDYLNVGFTQTDNDPVLCVTRETAILYTQWLSKKTGKNYRLPTETEWEYFARAGTTTTYFWGDTPTEACSYANSYDQMSKNLNNFQTLTGFFSALDCSDGYANAAPVGSYTPNRFGLYDVLGNAREWTIGDWSDSYVGAPSDESATTGGVPMFGVTRGGGWNYQAMNIRSAYRNAYFSSEVRTNMWGFRVVREI